MDHIAFKTSQPFFVQGSKNYKKYFFNKYGISYFYQTDSGSLPHVVVPDISTDILFCCSDENPSADICGQVILPDKALGLKNSVYFGVNFFFDFNLLFSEKFSAKELLGSKIPAEYIFKNSDSIKMIYETTDFEKQIEIFLDAYIPIYENSNVLSTKENIVICSLDKIIESGGRIPISLLCEKLGYSERYLNGIFRDYIGISAKTAESVIRFQTVLNKIENLSYDKNLTDISQSCGYFDQSHFIKEFRKFSGMTPKKFQNLILK